MQGTTYQSIDVNGHSVFYREAGSPDAPTLLLLHGFPSSSRMYEPLFSRLADTCHLVAPDYLGFGHSDALPSAFTSIATASLCRITADPSGFAWHWHIRSDWLRW